MISSAKKKIFNQRYSIRVHCIYYIYLSGMSQRLSYETWYLDIFGLIDHPIYPVNGSVPQGLVKDEFIVLL